jgi:hypothetical protein
MFEHEIAQAKDMIRRLETNIGLSTDQVDALPEASKVRIEEATAWDNVVKLGIAQAFGAESAEVEQWNKTWTDHRERGDFTPKGYAALWARQIAVLQELDGKLRLRDAPKRG